MIKNNLNYLAVINRLEKTDLTKPLEIYFSSDYLVVCLGEKEQLHIHNRYEVKYQYIDTAIKITYELTPEQSYNLYLRLGLHQKNWRTQ